VSDRRRNTSKTWLLGCSQRLTSLLAPGGSCKHLLELRAAADMGERRSLLLIVLDAVCVDARGAELGCGRKAEGNVSRSPRRILGILALQFPRPPDHLGSLAALAACYCPTSGCCPLEELPHSVNRRLPSVPTGPETLLAALAAWSPLYT
jgi:hypothetical protein